MLDVKMIRQNKEEVKQRLATRGVDPAEIDHLVELDEARREQIAVSENLKQKRNEVSKQIAELKTQ